MKSNDISAPSLARVFLGTDRIVCNPKTKPIDSVTMEVAVPVYRRMLARYPEPEMYVFFNSIANRDYAARRMGEMFNQVLEECGL